MKKLATFVSIVCLLNVLAALGLAGFLVATGRLDQPKAQAIADLLRHQGTPDNFREQLYDIIQPATTSAPATTTASRPAIAEGGDKGPATAEERIDFARQVMEQERLRLENDAQDLRHRHEMLLTLQRDVNAKLAEIKTRQKSFDDATAQAASHANDESFQKTMALYSELKPKQLKDLFATMPQDLVARYLAAMPADQAAKIITEFKTAEDRTFINAVLERIRGAGTNSASGKGTAEGATSTVVADGSQGRANP